MEKIVVGDLSRTQMTIRIKWLEATSYLGLTDYIQEGIDTYIPKTATSQAHGLGVQLSVDHWAIGQRPDRKLWGRIRFDHLDYDGPSSQYQTRTDRHGAQSFAHCDDHEHHERTTFPSI